MRKEFTEILGRKAKKMADTHTTARTEIVITATGTVAAVATTAIPVPNEIHKPMVAALPELIPRVILGLTIGILEIITTMELERAAIAANANR